MGYIWDICFLENGRKNPGVCSPGKNRYLVGATQTKQRHTDYYSTGVLSHILFDVFLA